MSNDIIIIGAGIMGLSTAYQIARRSSLTVRVLEAAAELGAGSTGASSAICRHRYSRDEMVVLARDGINAYRHWSDFTQIKSPQAEFQNDGVLWINGEGARWASQEQSRLTQLGISADVLSHDEIVRRFPSISTCLISPDFETGGSHECHRGDGLLFENDGGYFDPVYALNDLLVACQREGVDVQFNEPVAELLTTSGKATGVLCRSGAKHHADVVINMTGPWCNDILAPLGLADRWPLKPTRIQVLHINKPPELNGKIPVCCDSVSGVYFREQNRGQQIVIGSAMEEDEREVVDPSSYNNWIDDDFKAARLHGFAHRFPSLPENIQVTGYTGLYTVNQTDVHPVVGESGIPGFYVANGFSGHGFKIAPAIGSLLARTITGVEADFDTQIPESFLAFDRDPITVDTKSVLA